ncbi:hypothetical protein N7532_008804 [Penicillium argentinense]|uniref:Isochorismatase-like domain-containing protein n=1 Tax=Penicillium argentinense TaxID=1131581 RepID=A0A9W9K286_9EURO|nr:uncharacterized protein N7532_008804 [Penicillium argentinense]KAJ5090120.1 hypothetical protein N7532_008804 [Penicillium argentinense]
MTERIGHHPTNFWAYDAETGLVDLSRGAQGTQLSIQTTTNPIRLNPDTSVMVIVDMQNFFLSPAVRPRASEQNPTPAESAAQALLGGGIQAARRHGIRIVWLNWGLTEEDLRNAPPGMMRTFGPYDSSRHDMSHAVPSQDGMIRVKNRELYKGLGVEIGSVDLGGGQKVEGGRVLMRYSWNTALYGPLEQEFRANNPDHSSSASSKPDILIHKNRTSGLCLPNSDLENFLKGNGITTLLFAGVNTDQCVGSTLMDAASKGYDCILLRDASATTTPFSASETWEWNVANCWGWVTTCDALKDGKFN